MHKKNKIISLFSFKNRSFKCLFFSILIHLSIMLLLYILILPASRSEDKVIEVSFINTQAGLQEQEKDSDSQPFIPKVEDQEINPENNLDNGIQEIKDTFDFDDSQEAKQYLKELNKKIAQKKSREFASQHNKLSNSLKTRSKYGTLKPRSFYGVNIFATDMIFVLDISSSMDIRTAKLQLKNAYKSLKSNEYFNLVVYNWGASVWKQHLVPATEKNKQDANNWVNKLEARGATNIYGALKRTFEVAWQGKKAETIYFLSDGLPTAGKVMSPTKIISYVKDWNKGKKIIVNVIGIGPHQDRRFLGALAEENYGRYFIR